MGRPAVSASSSLDRLKSLDGLDNLDAQLHEAQQLCTHPARAEMILKWILAKLKSSLDYATRAECWNLVSSCIRLLYPQRIAFLLSTSGFIDALQSTCAAPEITIQLLSTIAGVLQLIFDLSDSRDGSSIKAVLTLDSSTAAPITGNWLQHLNSSNNTFEASQLAQGSVLDVPLRLWSMRKVSSDDGQLFSSHCLVPVSFLLTAFENEQVLSTKRKRGTQTGSSDLNHKRSLEALLAKHVLLPARAVFFKAAEPQPRKTSRSRPEVEHAGIKERLGPIKMAIRSDNSEIVANAVPLILDAGLRSVAMPTPKHRSHERLWIECLFEALQSCTHFQGDEQKAETLAAMVEVLVRHKFAMSPHKLIDLVKTYALRAEGSQQSLDLRLTLALVQLDVSIFNDLDIARSAFDALPSIQADDATSTQDLVRSIVVSIMRSFSQSRKLPLFVDMWNEQLLQSALSSDSVWLQLGDSFAEILEDSVSDDQIIRLLDHFTSVLKDEALSKSNIAEMESKVIAALSILGALLRGVHREGLPPKLQSRLDELLLALFKVTEADGSMLAVKAPQPLWSLFTRVFELWFPCWAAQQNDRKIIAERGVSLLIRKTFQVALSQSTVVGKSGLKDDLSIALCAQAFVATLSECFVRYEEHPQCVSLSTTALKQMGQHTEAAASACVKYPDLLQILPTALRKEILTSLVQHAVSRQQENEDNHYLATLTFLASHDRHHPHDECALLLKQLEAPPTARHAEKSELAILQILRGSVVDMSSEQRTELLEAVTKLPKVQSDRDGSILLQERIALIVELVTSSATVLQFTANLDALWTLATLFNEESKKKANKPTTELGTASNLHLLQEIVWQVISGWVMSAGKKSANPDLFISLSERMNSVCSKRSTFIGSPASLSLLKTASIALEGCPDSVKPNLQHRDAGTIVHYIETLVKDVKTLAASCAKSKNKKSSETELQALSTSLDALLAVPDSLLAEAPTHDELTKGIASSLDGQAQLIREDDDLISVDVLDFRLQCKYAATTAPALTQQAERVLQRDLEAQDYAAVLSAYENVLAKAEREWRTSAITSLVQVEDPTIQSILLLRRAMKTVDKDDFDSGLSSIAVFNYVLHSASGDTTYHVSHLAWQTLTSMIKEQPFLLNQYSIEQTLIEMAQTLSSSKHASSVYMDVAGVLEALFSHHRSRLQGRFHLLVALFQAFLTCLFRKSENSEQLGLRQARTLARLLESLCNPPRVRHRGKTSELVDEARKAQAHAGQYARYILHHYCAQVLTGPLDGIVKDALMPGIWSLIEAIEINNSEGIKSLSAAMNNSERAVLRSVYDDWKRFGKWQGL